MKREPVEIEVEGLKLRGKIFWPAAEPKTAVLFLHGWTGMTNEAAAGAVANNGYAAMTISYSGHNDSEGKLEDQTRQKSFKEVLAAYDLFKSKLPESIRIVVAGNSYGGYLALLLSAERKVSGIQLRVPANYSDNGFDQFQLNQGGANPEVMKWREQEHGPDETRALLALSDFKGPVQILEAENDELIPHQLIQDYVKAITDKTQLDYRLMEGWEHSLGEDEERNRKYQNVTLEWLKKI
jgi:esterase/lipase